MGVIMFDFPKEFYSLPCNHPQANFTVSGFISKLGGGILAYVESQDAGEYIVAILEEKFGKLNLKIEEYDRHA